MELQNKVALVTGGAVRVGRAISCELLSKGVQLYCHYYQSEKKALELKEQFPEVNLIQKNLGLHHNAQLIIDQIMEEKGKIDILINNAAIFIRTPLGQVSEQLWDMQFNLNLKAGFFLAQEAGKVMQRHGSGKIINIADTSGLSAWPSYIPYSITKSGVINMTKGLARALAPNVQVNAINPGPVYLPDYYTSEQREKAIANTLLKREGKSEDIASAVRFLLEDGDYLTGVILSVDGGRSLS